MKAILLLVCLLLTACVYRMDVQQGNDIKPERITMLQKGMTKAQAAYVMGSPVAENTFDLNRWDYVSYYRQGNTDQPSKQQQLSLIFQGGKLTKILKPKP